MIVDFEVLKRSYFFIFIIMHNNCELNLDGNTNTKGTAALAFCIMERIFMSTANSKLYGNIIHYHGYKWFRLDCWTDDPIKPNLRLIKLGSKLDSCWRLKTHWIEVLFWFTQHSPECLTIAQILYHCFMCLWHLTIVMLYSIYPMDPSTDTQVPTKLYPGVVLGLFELFNRMGFHCYNVTSGYHWTQSNLTHLQP